MKRRRKPGRLPILGITMGDPAGIGPEVILKALARREVWRISRPLVIGSVPVMCDMARRLKAAVTVVPLGECDEPVWRPGQVAVLDPLKRPLGPVRLGRAAARTGDASVAFITKAVELAQAKRLDAVVTAPINKEAMNLAGHHFPGHTELLAHLTGTREVGMMILGGPLKIMFVTTHVAIKDLPRLLSVARIAKAIRLADKALREFFRVRRPRIGVAALNPHAGESGLFGLEERRCIQPAVNRARAAGINASDPLPADTLFGKAARGDYDGVVAMYHDQGLIPLKLLAFGRCINVTIGIPIIRTSVDHGTAYDIAGKGLADPGSLLEAMGLAAKLARRKR